MKVEFRKYQHLERYGTTETEGIEIGECLIFPKIDGTNASIWLDDEGNVNAGSRARVLSVDNDNAGFCKFVIENENIKKYLEKHPTHRLYGEWLVPHSLKTYREDAWRKFYVFDVCLDKGEDSVEYIPYDIYKPLLDEFGIEYIIPIGRVTNGSYELFLNSLEKNFFLIKDGEGTGEGVVIKNYDFYNRYKRQTWAKLVTSEFKEKHYREMGCPTIQPKEMLEQKIVDEFCTEAFIEKEHAKIVLECDGWTSKQIPMLLGRVMSEMVKEETWNFVKKFKYPTVNFKTLNTLVINKIKKTKPEIFQ